MDRRIRFQIFILVLVGSIVRFLYGYFYTPWDSGGDHIAMEILIQNGSWAYIDLIHYPHEGGTIITTLLGRFISIFTSFNALAIVAFLFDILARIVQLVVVRKITNNYVFWIFGLWTIFAVPIMLPWASLSFGLHAISAVFPFLLIYILSRSTASKKYFVLLGLFIGFAIWFSYINIVLILPFILLPILLKLEVKSWLLASLSLLGIMIIHYLVRLNFDSGFELSGLNMGSIRGEAFDWGNMETYKRLYKFWVNPLPESAVVIQNTNYVFFWFKYIWIAIAGASLIGFFIKKGQIEQVIYLRFATVMILAFISIYAISPFYYEKDVFGHAFNYRHFTYILPLISFVIIWGLSLLPFKQLFTGVFLCLSVYLGIISFTITPTENKAEMPAGWVLVQKYGTNPKKLYRLINESDYNQSELLVGIGWGISSILFNDVSSLNSALVNSRCADLAGWVDDFSVENKHELTEGIVFSFGEYITPKLDTAMLPII